jgi:hypothetical protein
MKNIQIRPAEPGRDFGQLAEWYSILENNALSEQYLTDYYEKPDQEQKDMLVEFEMRNISSASPAIRNAFVARGISSPMVKSLFRTYLAESMYGANWNTPTDSELLTFSIKT